MNPHRAFNIALAFALALLLSASYLLDGPSDIEAMQATQAAKQDAINSAATHATPTRASVAKDQKTTLAQVQP